MRRVVILLRVAGVLFLAAVLLFGWFFWDILVQTDLIQEELLVKINSYFDPDEAEVRFDKPSEYQGGGFRIENFEVVDRRGGAHPFIEVGEVIVEGGGFLDPFSIAQVRFVRPEVYLRRDDEGGWNFQRLIRIVQEDARDEAESDRPQLVLENAIIRYDDPALLAEGVVHEIRIDTLILAPFPTDSLFEEPYYTVYARLKDPILGWGEIDGEWAFASGRGELRVAFDRPEFDSDDADRFVGPVREFLTKISTHVTGSIRGTIERTETGAPVDYHVEADVRGTFSGFEAISDEPIQVGGQVLFDNGDLIVRDLTADWAGRTLAIDGTVLQAIDDPSIDLQFVFVDPDPAGLVAELLGPEAERIGLRFEPDERLHVRFDIKRRPESQGYVAKIRAYRLGPGQTEPTGELLLSAGGWIQAGGERYELGESRVTIAGYEVDVSGHLAGKLSEPEVDLVLRAVDWELDDRLGQLLGPLGEDLWRVARPEGQVDATLLIHRDRGPEGRFVYQPALTLRQATLHVEDLERPLEQVEARARLDGDQIVVEGARATYGAAHLIVDTCRLARDAEGRFEPVHVEARADGVRLDEIRPVLPADARHLVGQLGLGGIFDVVLRLDRRSGVEEVLEVEAAFRELTFCQERFPLPVTAGRGTALYDHLTRSLELDAEVEKGEGSRLSVEGAVTFDENADLSGASVGIEASNILLTQGEVAIFSRTLADLLAVSGDGGRFDLIGRIESEGPGELVPDITISPRRVTLLFDSFPYPIDDVEGRIRITPAGLGAVDLRGHRGSMGFHLTHPSRAELRAAGRPLLYRVAVRMTEVPLDEEFRHALTNDMQEMWTAFEPQGRVDLFFELGGVVEATERRSGMDLLLSTAGGLGVLGRHWPAESETETFAEIGLTDARFRFEDFPYPVSGLSGRVRFVDDAIELRYLEGQRAGARLGLSGRIVGKGADRSVDLAVSARGLPLDEALRGALDEERQEIWERFRPEGRVDVDATLTQRAGVDAEVRKRVDIVPAGPVRVTFESFPIPLDIVSGRIRLGVGAGPLFEQLVARHGDARLDLAGRMIEFGDGYHLELEAEVRDLELGSGLKAAIEEAFPGVWETLEPSGRIPAGEVRIRAARSAEGEVQVDYRVEAAIEEGAMTFGYPVENLSGRGFSRGWIRDGEHHLEEALFEDLDFDLRGMGFRGLRTRAVMEGKTLTLSRIEGAIMGGSLTGRMIFDTGPLHAFEGEFRIDDIDLGRATDILLGDDVPEGDELSGTLSGRASVAGVVGDVESLKARGLVGVENGRLWSLPLFLAIFDIFELPEKPAFQKAEMEFTLSESRIRFSNVRMDSNPLILYGEGSMGLQGDLDLSFVSELAPGVTPRVPVVSRYWRDLKKGVLPIRVTGSFDEPQVAVVPFRFFQDMVSPGDEGR